MKRVKRLFACLLALTMMLGLSATAFATETAEKVQTPANGGTVTFEKEYKLVGEGISPAETFEFNIAKAGVENGGVDAEKQDMPTVGTAAYDSKSVTMKVTAVDNNGTIEIAAVSFTKAGKKLANNEAAFNNTYTANKLSISKTVAGNLGDKSKYFDFTVTLTGKEGEEYSLPATITGGSDKSGKKENVAISGTTTFKLKHGDTITIENLPAGVSYKVEEATPSDYTMNATGQEGTMDAEAKTAAFTNTKTGDIDTGVYLDNLPYILVFAGVLAIAAVFIVRRRRFED